MKKKLLFALAGLYLCGFSFAQNTVIEVPKTSAGITIDGDVESTWDLAQAYTIDWWGKDKPTPDASDFSASFKVMWDDSYLYFLGMITDDILMDSAACADATIPDWEVDNWENYLAPGNSHLTDAIQVRLPYANAEGNNSIAGVVNGYSFGGLSVADFVTAAKSETFDGYVVEASYDLAALSASVQLSGYVIGDTIGFNAVACDNDGEATRENIGGIIQGFTYNECDTLIRLVLGDIVSGIKNTSANSVTVYPTVATDLVRISNFEMLALVDIIDLQGRNVYHSVSPRGTINIEALRPGMYIFRAFTRTGDVINRKIIKR